MTLLRNSFITVPLVAAIAAGCLQPGSPRANDPVGNDSSPSVQGAWRVVEFASREPGRDWIIRRSTQPGLYVFSARHYSYAYVPANQPRLLFNDANRPTEAEKSAAYDSFIAGAGTYTFDGTVLVLNAEIRKNPNEMTGDSWPWQTEFRGDTVRLVFLDPPFLPGREWRTVLVRVE